MTLLDNMDLSTGNLSQFGDWEWGGSFDGTPPLSQRVQVLSGGPGGYNRMNLSVAPGDNFGGSTGWRTLGRQASPIPIRQSGYDSCMVWATRVPTGWPFGANPWLAGREWHHTGGAVAPSHFIIYSGNMWMDVFGGQETSKTTYVAQSFLSGYTKGVWYIFCERYRHGLAPNGHYELWTAKVGTDSSMTRIIYAPNIGTMYSGFGNYILFGHYRDQSGGSTSNIDFAIFREYSSLTEGLAWASSFLTGSPTPPPPDPDPPPFPPPTSTIAANTRDRRAGVTTIPSQRYGFALNYQSGSKIATGLQAGEEGDAYDFHIPIQGGDSNAGTCTLVVKLFDDQDADGKPDALIGTCSVNITPAGNQNMTWMKVTSASPIRFTGQNVWLIVAQTVGPTNRALFATQSAANGLAYATPIASPFGWDGFEQFIMASAFDYDVVSGTETPPGDATAPTLSTATITATSLVLSYNEPLDTGSTPATGDFAVKVNTVPVAKSSVMVSGSTVTVTLSAPVLDSDTVTVSYTPGSNKIQDIAGNDAGTLTDQAVTNNSPDVSIGAVTLMPTEVDEDSAQFNGTVNPNGVDSVGYFEYGTSTAYELGATVPVNVGSGVLPVNISFDVSNLTVGLTYHYRTVRDDA